MTTPFAARTGPRCARRQASPPAVLRVSRARPFALNEAPAGPGSGLSDQAWVQRAPTRTPGPRRVELRRADCAPDECPTRTTLRRSVTSSHRAATAATPRIVDG